MASARSWHHHTAVGVACLGLLVLIAPAQAAPRSGIERAAFKRAHPCPATGVHRGSCPGFVIDHVRPLCAGGPDLRTNMQWQSVPEALAKDRLERRECRALRRRR